MTPFRRRHRLRIDYHTFGLALVVLLFLVLLIVLVLIREIAHAR